MIWRYDVAQICLNGHIANHSTERHPENNKAYCDKCGVKTITSCPHCKCPIQGEIYKIRRYRHVPLTGYSPAAVCQNCWKPFPWIEAKLKAAKEHVVELEGLSEEEKEIMRVSLDDMITESASSEVATTRFKKLMKKATGEAVPAIRALIMDIASEKVKKLIQG